MCSLDQLAVFKEAADSGNITLAAKRLHISQPSVSVHIRNLEREYKTELFKRTNRGVELTQAGKILYDKATTILCTIETANEEIAAYRNSQSMLVHIGATLTIGEYLLPSILGLSASYSDDYKLNAHIANTATVIKEILDDKLSIGLVEGPFEDDDELVAEEFWHDELVLVVAYDHPWATRDEIGFEDLMEEQYVTREKGSGTRRVAAESLSRCGYDVNRLNVAMELSSTTAIKETVAAGVGFTILSALTVQNECRSKRLAMLRICGCNLSRPLRVVRRRNRSLSDAEQYFLDFVLQRELLAKVIPAPELPQVGLETSEGRLAARPVEEMQGPRLPLPDSCIPNWFTLPDTERQICTLLHDNGSMNSAEIAHEVGLVQRNVLPFVNDLIASGLVVGYGGSKNRRYRIVETCV